METSSPVGLSERFWNKFLAPIESFPLSHNDSSDARNSFRVPAPRSATPGLEVFSLPTAAGGAVTHRPNTCAFPISMNDVLISL